MANTDAAFGLKPVRYKNGSPWNGSSRAYYVPSTDSTALFIGDPVVVVGDSNDNAVLGFPANTLSEVTRATVGATNRITGVVTSVLPVTNDSTVYREASTERVVMVCDDPNVIYEIQDDGGGALTADTVGLNAVLIAGTGDATYGQSRFELDGGTTTAPTADATYQLTILGLAKRQDNEMADYAIWDVLINLPSPYPGIVGVA